MIKKMILVTSLLLSSGLIMSMDFFSQALIYAGTPVGKVQLAAGVATIGGFWLLKDSGDSNFKKIIGSALFIPGASVLLLTAFSDYKTQDSWANIVLKTVSDVSGHAKRFTLKTMKTHQSYHTS